MKLIRKCAWGAALLVGTWAAFGLDQEQIISDWLARQTNVQSWSADFVQTRKLKGFASPLVSTGEVWFGAPQNFRWELGKNQTIAVRSNDVMLVMYPRLKRAEKYDFENAASAQWKASLSLLQSGFPRSRADINERFKILSLTPTNNIYDLALEPLAPGARKMMPRLNIYISTNSALAGTELTFADGSTMRNDFKDQRTNAPVEGKFDLDVPPEYKLVEPLKANGK